MNIFWTRCKSNIGAEVGSDPLQAERGMRNVPVGSVPVRSVASRRVLGFSGPKGFEDPSWEKSFPVLS